MATGERIPFLDLRRRWRELGPRFEEASARVLASGRLLDGPEVAAFEREWATFNGRAHAVAVASGTDAISLALVAAGIGRGDEVIVPAFTAIPTIAAVCVAGATPVPVDVDAESGALDPAAADAAVGERTRAAVVVHLYGRPAPLPELSVPVIEDAAHAHGAITGAGSLAAAYSFYPTKNLGGIGDGGAVVTDDAELAEHVRLLRSHGREPEGQHQRIAANSRMSELEAAALRIGLAGLEAQNQRRRLIAAAYRAAAPGLRWQAPHPEHVHHLCVARVGERDRYRAGLPFETAIHYPSAVPDEPAYRLFAAGDCPNARAWAAECVSFPCHPGLSDDEVERVSGALA